MPISRPIKIVGSAAAAAGLFFGTAALAGAATAQPAQAPAPAESTPAEPTEDTNETTTEVDDNVQDPSYTSSISAPAEVDGQSEADESASLAPLAKITADEAAAAAQAVVPGDVIRVELENENGAVVYGVEIGNVDVKVDAGTGQVLHQDTGND